MQPDAQPAEPFVDGRGAAPAAAGARAPRWLTSQTRAKRSSSIRAATSGGIRSPSCTRRIGSAQPGAATIRSPGRNPARTAVAAAAQSASVGARDGATSATVVSTTASEATTTTAPSISCRRPGRIVTAAP